MTTQPGDATGRLRGGAWTGYAPLDAAGGERRRAAVRDIRQGLRRYVTWRYLAVESIKNQYRRTVLGPWWLTLQTAVYVVGLALIFGQILGAGLRAFLPYVALGYVAFILLSGLTRAGAQVFVQAASTMKSTQQPLSNLVLRDVTIEFIQFAHNMLIYLAFVAGGLVPLRWQMVLTVPAVLLIAINGMFVALWLGPIVARFRDVGPLVLSVLQVSIFFTPVFYKLSNLHGSRRALVVWNPFTYLIEAFRAPLIGGSVSASVYVGSALVTLINVALGISVFARVRSRLPYWVA